MRRNWLAESKTIKRLGFGVAVAVTATMLLMAWVGPALWDRRHPTFLDRLESASLDFRFLLRGPRDPGEEIVVVAIDDLSLKELGRWPWSRDKQAGLVKRIGADGAKVIALDIMYLEPEVTEHLSSLRDLMNTAKTAEAASPALRALLQQKLAQADTDQQFVQSLGAVNNAVLALPLVVPMGDANHDGVLPDTRVPDYIARHMFMLVRNASRNERLQPLRAVDYHSPIKPFVERAVSLGHVYTIPDPDGVTRYEYLALRYGARDHYYPSFALEVARLFLDVPRERASLRLGEGVTLEDRFVPSDQKSRMLINYLGPERTFPYVSATDVIHNRVAPGRFQGKLVLIGTTALGTYDQKTTPFSANVPGVEVIATVVENILHGQFLIKNIWSGPLDFGLTLVFGLTLGMILPRMKAVTGAALAISVLVGYGLAAFYLFQRQGIWVGVVYPMATIALTFVSITVLRFMTEEQQKKEIRQMFSSYLSPAIVGELIKDPMKARIGGSRKEVTMLFSDIIGFTSFSEKREAEEVVAQLNEYLNAMTDIVFHWHGTLDKFVGDALVVFWGAPLEQPNHVELAVKCALHMRKRVTELQSQWIAEGKPPLDIGIGINTGMAVVGNIGAEGKKMDYTVIGDHMNLAAKIETFTRTLAYRIVMTEYSAERLKSLIAAGTVPGAPVRIGHVKLTKLGAVSIKGKDRPIVIYGLESLPQGEPSKLEEAVQVDLQLGAEKLGVALARPDPSGGS